MKPRLNNWFESVKCQECGEVFERYKRGLGPQFPVSPCPACGFDDETEGGTGVPARLGDHPKKPAPIGEKVSASA